MSYPPFEELSQPYVHEVKSGQMRSKDIMKGQGGKIRFESYVDRS